MEKGLVPTMIYLLGSLLLSEIKEDSQKLLQLDFKKLLSSALNRSCVSIPNSVRKKRIYLFGFSCSVATDPGRRQIWENAVRQTINTEMKGSSKDDYVLLRSGQLVGAALLVFVRSSALKKIKNVEGSVKKVCIIKCSCPTQGRDH